jgi:hypothetical protein
MNKIIFHDNRYYNSIFRHLNPIPAFKKIPKWYSSADKYQKNEEGETLLKYDGGRLPSFKTCPALLDAFTSGYMYTTPCDLFFYMEDGIPKVKTEEGFEDFCEARPPMKDFVSPHGYYESHFHWYPNWAPKLPKGYSALYVHPINRFDLPFTTVGGIIDNDNMDTPGLMPFFLKDNFEGKVLSGTPYVQIIPFKREDWQMEIKQHTQDEILERHEAQANLYRTKEGGAYKKYTWSKKKYI